MQISADELRGGELGGQKGRPAYQTLFVKRCVDQRRTFFEYWRKESKGVDRSMLCLR
jgi:hypothetical protein